MGEYGERWVAKTAWPRILQQRYSPDEMALLCQTILAAQCHRSRPTVVPNTTLQPPGMQLLIAFSPLPPPLTSHMTLSAAPPLGVPCIRQLSNIVVVNISIRKCLRLRAHSKRGIPLRYSSRPPHQHQRCRGGSRRDW